MIILEVVSYRIVSIFSDVKIEVFTLHLNNGLP